MTSPAIPAGVGGQQWLQRLAASSQFVPQRMSLFLAEHFFNMQAGRALILQPARRIGYFYLRPATYDRADLLAGEIKQFLDLFALLARLRADRLLYLLGGDARDQPMIFVGDLFDHPKPSSAHVVLNARGDYSFAPETIQDADDNVIYKGVLLDAEVYELVASCVHGMFYLSDEHRAQLLDSALASGGPEAAVAPPLLPQPGKWPWITGAAALALLGASWWAARPAALPAYARPHSPAHAAGPTVAVAPAVAVKPAAPAVPVPAPAALPALPAVPPETTLAGIDISKWNADAATLLREKSIAFAFARASFGLTPDPAFAANRKAMRQNGIAHGAYHVFSYQSDPAQQAERFAALLGAAAPRELCPAVDVEEGSFPSRAAAPPAAAVRDARLSHLLRLEQRIGCIPLIYTNRAVGNQYLDDARFARYPLWIADWSAGAKGPVLPAAWHTAGYRFWQKSASFAFADEPRDPTDYDQFAGSHADLARLYRLPGRAPATP